MEDWSLTSDVWKKRATPATAHIIQYRISMADVLLLLKYELCGEILFTQIINAFYNDEATYTY